MAETDSDIAALQADPKMGNRADAVQTTAVLLKADALYTLTGSEAATDTIRIVKLPIGSRIDVAASWAYAENPGTALNLDIGDSTDTDRYSDNLDLSSGGLKKFEESGTTPAAALTPFTLTSTEDGWLKATVATATSLTAAQTIRFHIVYAAPV